ncbi:hypothetical protein V1477_002901 [Vespula maculifrons]|uniref:Uncharacterized protein n=1 Tax=Vespula maculifrons TaxID=7453 RepID=A0ABD2CUG9_VESMC
MKQTIRRYTGPSPMYRKRRPAQKPTPMGPSHGSHPRETIIINLMNLLPYIRKIKDFGKVFKYAAIRSEILAAYKKIDVSQVMPTQVPPRGGCCSWRPTD